MIPISRDLKIKLQKFSLLRAGGETEVTLDNVNIGLEINLDDTGYIVPEFTKSSSMMSVHRRHTEQKKSKTDKNVQATPKLKLSNSRSKLDDDINTMTETDTLHYNQYYMKICEFWAVLMDVIA